MTSGLRNLEYYRGAFLEIQKYMEEREESLEVQEETVPPIVGGFLGLNKNVWTHAL